MTTTGAPQGRLADVLPALLRMQVDLGGELSTAALAATTSMSPSRFHEAFRRATGETVKQYTLRLRLEHAAFRLLTERTGVAAIAFDLGFGSHEVFTRAFRRAYGMPPTRFRSRMKPHRRATGGLGDDSAAAVGGTCLDDVGRAPAAGSPRVRPPGRAVRPGRPRRVRPSPGLDVRPCAGPDLPGRHRPRRARITPAARLRFDVGVQISRPFRGSGEVGYGLLPERWCAATSYVGPFAGLADAYRAAYQGASALRGFEVLGLPVEEKYLTSALVTQQEIQTTQLLIPLRRTVPG